MKNWEWAKHSINCLINSELFKLFSWVIRSSRKVTKTQRKD